MKNLILILLLAFTNLASATAPPDNENEAVIINSQLKVISKTENEENIQQYYKIDTTYPQITGRSLSSSAQNFNQKIHKIITTEIENFKNSITHDAAHMKTLPESVRNNSFTMDYDVDVIHPGPLTLISVRLNIEGMQAGRAHPFHRYRVLNFDLTHGKELALSDLFQPRKNYLKALATYSNHKLNASLQDKWMIANGAKPTAANYKNWNIQGDSLLITFDEYQVAPYANGPQEVEIPYKELQNIFSSKALMISRAKDAFKTVG
ncbi:MAG: pdaC 2 [Gammaproteobacteria bacterium]|jgi:hypothetical protein|nr:pdaC 2 [Gammaproteobacteria bacterium]